MKIYKKELYLGAEGAQSAQLCGLNHYEGGFSHSPERCCKQDPCHWQSRVGMGGRHRQKSARPAASAAHDRGSHAAALRRKYGANRLGPHRPRPLHVAIRRF
jgi:hypothetical protein